MRKIEIDFMPYYKWYANWINWKSVSVNDFINKRVENPFAMLSDWLDMVSIKIDKNVIGREVYYSLNAEHRDTITYDTYLEGCIIKKGMITDVLDGVLQIDGKNFTYSSYETRIFEKPEYCILCLCYDGCNIFEGNQLLPEFSEDLFVIEI